MSVSHGEPHAYLAEGTGLAERFVATPDNTDWSPAYAQRILDAKEGEDVVFPAIYGPSADDHRF